MIDKLGSAESFEAPRETDPIKDFMHELQNARLSFDKFNGMPDLLTIEAYATQLCVPVGSQPGRGLEVIELPDNAEDLIAQKVLQLEKLVTKVVGHKVTVWTNYHCTAREDGSFVEAVHEVSPLTFSGIIRGIHSFVAEFDTYATSKPGCVSSVAVRLAHYRICIQIDDCFIPLDTLNGTWNGIEKYTS